MLDSLKTTIGSAGTVGISIWGILGDVVSLIIGILWIIHLVKKIKMEFK